MGTLIDFVRQRGTQRLVGQVLRENLPMRNLAPSWGFELDEASSDNDSVRFVLDLASRPKNTA
jgi:hypothetical protein